MSDWPRERCPDCEVCMVMLRSFDPDRQRQRIQIPLHTRGRAIRLPDWDAADCPASGVWLDEAQAIVRIREEGGERFRLAAHP